MTYLIINGAFVIGLMIVGVWLEQIGANDGFADQFLTPLPLGILGLLVVMERGIA